MLQLGSCRAVYRRVVSRWRLASTSSALRRCADRSSKSTVRQVLEALIAILSTILALCHLAGRASSGCSHPFADRARSAKPGGEGDAVSSRGRPESARRADDAPEDHYMGDLFSQLSTVVKSNPSDRFSSADGMSRC